MQVHRDIRDGVAVLTPTEPVVVGQDNARKLEEAVLESAQDAPLVILDASQVDFFESEGVDSLLLLERHLAERKGRLVLTGLNNQVAEVFRINGLDCLFQIYPDVDMAVRGLLGPSPHPETWH